MTGRRTARKERRRRVKRNGEWDNKGELKVKKTASISRLKGEKKHDNTVQ